MNTTLASPLAALLREWSWSHARHQPVRHLVAVLAVALGVALAFSVHLINASALSEFSSAVRATSGQPDLELRAARGPDSTSRSTQESPRTRASHWRAR